MAHETTPMYLATAAWSQSLWVSAEKPYIIWLGALDMGQNEERYVMVPNPLKPGQTVRAKVLNYEKIRGEDHEYRLEDGSRIRLA